MAHTRRSSSIRRHRPLNTRIKEAKDKLDRLELQSKIKELRARFGRTRR